MWELLSRDGWQRIDWHPADVIHGDQVVIPTELRLSGQFWDPRALIEIQEYKESLHYECKLPVILLALDRVDSLISHLETWLRDRSPFDMRLSPQTYQALAFHLGQRDDIVSSADRPVCTVQYTSARIRWEWLLPVDHGCLERFCVGLKEWQESTPHSTQ